ncbi:MAG: hypothetical protein ACRDNJ_02740 [Solirubrobacteraceae bacterium]
MTISGWQAGPLRVIFDETRGGGYRITQADDGSLDVELLDSGEVRHIGTVEEETERHRRTAVLRPPAEAR